MLLSISENLVCIYESFDKSFDVGCGLNGWQLAKMKKSIPGMSLP